MNSYDLLSVAELLAFAQARKPSQAFLRRSISSSYYAAFHALAAMCANQLIGHGQSDHQDWRHVYRALDHRSAKNALPLAAARLKSADLSQFATVFRSLQESRHQADYDPHEAFSRADALTWAKSARTAIQALERLPDGIKRSVAASVLLRTRD